MVAGPRGLHDAGAVDAALEGLLGEGLIEPAGEGRVRLPRRVAQDPVRAILKR